MAYTLRPLSLLVGRISCAAAKRTCAALFGVPPASSSVRQRDQSHPPCRALGRLRSATAQRSQSVCWYPPCTRLPAKNSMLAYLLWCRSSMPTGILLISCFQNPFFLLLSKVTVRCLYRGGFRGSLTMGIHSSLPSRSPSPVIARCPINSSNDRYCHMFGLSSLD